MSSVETRNADRDSLFVMADLAIEGAGPAIRVKVRNLSAYGMMVETDMRLARGTKVAVELRNIGAVTGTVVWARGHRFGVAFEEEIDPKMARTTITGSPREAPTFARAAIDAPLNHGWNGRLRRI